MKTVKMKLRIPFAVVSKKDKYFSINVTKESKTNTLKTTKRCWKKLRKTEINGKRSHVP